MSTSFSQNQTIGILGGGQLGRMMLQSGVDLNLNFSVLDPDAAAPCSGMTKFTQGRLSDYAAVVAFGQGCDVITIEIESVNTEALRELANIGKRVYPQPEIIELIQDKRKQKQFYLDNKIPTAPFILIADRSDVERHASFLPAVNKLGRDGYDGKGVSVIKTRADIEKAFDAPGLLEKWVDFEKEIAVIVARNLNGEIKSYPVVEMVFHPEANLVEYLFAPADIPVRLALEADEIAKNIISKLGMVGLLAVEMFVTKTGEILVNEIAPRPHNSGHQTIEANVTSQYEQHLRAILNLPLGDTTIVGRSAMVNLLGEDGYSGIAKYEGLYNVLAIPGVHVHLYGKKMTKPFRKMGHVTIVDQDIESLKKKVNFVKENLKVIA